MPSGGGATADTSDINPSQASDSAMRISELAFLHRSNNFITSVLSVSPSYCLVISGLKGEKEPDGEWSSTRVRHARHRFLRKFHRLVENKIISAAAGHR